MLFSLRFRIQLIKSYRTDTCLNEKDLALSSLEYNLDILTNELPIKVLINNKDQIFSDEEVLDYIRRYQELMNN